VQLIDLYLDKTKFESAIAYTKRAKHAIELTTENAAKYDIIAAVGGDGSVNEVAKSLLNTNTALGIIPTGSGNGISRNLGIHMNLKKAILHINTGQKKIDIVKINTDYFIGTAGVGFDAYISWKFDEASTRGLFTYIKVAFKGFWTYQSTDCKVIYGAQEKKIKKGLLVTFANSKQYGNNIFIAPKAKIDDGLLRLVIVRKFPLSALLKFGYYLLSKQITKFKYTEEIVSNKMTLISSNTKIHIDGEPLELANKIEVEVLHKKIKVIVP
jgi:YegS/Rv2252/BmrU family lipid kinase